MRHFIKKSILPFSLSISLVFIPSSTFANTGSALFMASVLQLLIGNIVIGILEGILIALIFKMKFRIMIPVMIVANYVSMIAGAFIISKPSLVSMLLGNAPLYNAGRAVVILAIASYFLTIILEWPFCASDMLRTPPWLKKSILASVIAQTVSYFFLFFFYSAASVSSFFDNVEVDSSVVSNSTDAATVFFISPEAGEVYRIRPNGQGLQKVLDLEVESSSPRLIVRQAEDLDRWDLWVRETYDEEHMLIQNFASAAPFGEELQDTNGHYRMDRAVYPGLADKKRWEVTTDMWPGVSIRAKNMKTGEQFSAGLETPFLRWPSSSANVLPSDKAVYEFGEQIVLLDLNSRKMGLITLGKAPVVVLDEDFNDEEEMILGDT